VQLESGRLEGGNRPLQLFRPRFRVEEALSQIRECLEDGWTGSGHKTLEIEQAWRDYTGLPHAHFVNSATAALHLAVRVLKEQRGWHSGDEVITTPITFVSTNHAILYEGLSPVFADVDEYACLSPESVLSQLTPRTRAVMFVGLGGRTGRLEEIVDICRANGLSLILDAAHLAGTKFKGEDPGHLADAACYSFQAVKNVPTADSGMVCFIDPEMDALARKLSWLGIDKDTYSRSSGGSYAWMYGVENLGYKYNGNSVMAALALVGLKYLDEDNARRYLINAYYEDLLGLEGFQVVPSSPNCRSSNHLTQVVVENRPKVIRALQEHSIFPGVHYRDNLDYPMYSHAKGSCPQAEYFSHHLLSLPNHYQVTENDAAEVASIIAQSGRPAPLVSRA